ncbi:MAG: RibD family protein [Spirochaetota bacterium]
MSNRRPRVTLTYAQSLDGRIATSTGKSRWISGEQTLRLAHELRRDHDAILVGAGTVIADDPRLTCRVERGRDPHRCVLDSRLRIPATAHVVAHAGEVATSVFHAESAADPTCTQRAQALREAGVELVAVPATEEGLDLHAVLEHIGALGYASLLVEGGSAVLTSFYRARLVDRLVLVSAPMVVGTGTEAVGDLGIEDLSGAQRGTTRRVRQLGDDVVWEIDFVHE